MTDQSRYKHIVPLDKLKFDLKMTIHHDNVVYVMGRNGDMDVQGIYFIWSYNSHYRGGVHVYSVPLGIDTSGVPVLQYKLNRLDKWMRKEWDKLCLIRGVRKGKYGRGTVHNMASPKITFAQFMEHLQQNQHTY